MSSNIAASHFVKYITAPTCESIHSADNLIQKNNISMIYNDVIQSSELVCVKQDCSPLCEAIGGSKLVSSVVGKPHGESRPYEPYLCQIYREQRSCFFLLFWTKL